ncbi:MarR family winged helix-turn-helix transcriptional regulator [Streptomyces clavuligerus]|uniref:MarR family winged helix-turn-helix transcriptional regulator n=1 Tax=Streptomyces clavuligerus TaxID=1901 RepID=UPI000E4FE932|nr:MarR family transcriptional regulator [Streptomyces clavuligerus]AXU17528.1 MarR family transcriptional regulator [Streptomyces clavuligerus]
MEIHQRVLGEIARALDERHRLSVSEFDTLVNIPLDGVRLKDLGSRTVLTQSAVSRMCDRLARRGLVTRTPVPEDQRGALVRLTDEGRELLRAAVRTNAEVVERTFAARLGDADLVALHTILGRVAPEGGTGEECDTPAEEGCAEGRVDGVLYITRDV